MLNRNPEMAWELRMDGPPSPDVLQAVAAGVSIDYAQVKSLADFILIQVGWLPCGFHYNTALRLAAERKALEFRESFLTERYGHDVFEECFSGVRRRMSMRLAATEAVGY
jgi:hypothetical protein